ncbi:MAG: hypothetical protein KF774_16190 [Planctomyces sp.]|nr:hypothetical protein [Planctomyces sp.]
MTAPADLNDGPSRGQAAVLLVAAIWLAAFSIYFYRQPLPNNSTADRPLTRVDVWQAAPDLLLDCVVAETERGQPAPGWRNFPQRFEALGTALFVLAGGFSLGSLLLRGLGLREMLREDRAGRWAAGGLLGLSAWSLATLGLGLAGVLRRDVFVALLGGLIVVAIGLKIADRSPPNPIPLWRRRFLTGDPFGTLSVLIVAPFLLAMLLGALLPPTDFDVKAYHLVGPKEWHQAGRITFLPHNVYTSFPFLTEMLCLASMVVHGDWHRGGIAGQAVLAAFAPLTAGILFSIGRRLFSERAGWLAVVVYLTTPWVCRISVIAYVEGALAAYLAASLWSWLLLREPGPSASALPGDERVALRRERMLVWLCGAFAGSAMACKYPGLLSAVLPFGLAIAFAPGRRAGQRATTSAVRRVMIYTMGVAAACGPWLLKNVWQTGNPVYPLLWSVFGGRGFDAELAAKFSAGHRLPIDVLSSPARWLPDLWAHLRDVAIGSDWQSALIAGLAPASLTVFVGWSRRGESASAVVDAARRRTVAALWLYAAWLFLSWWGLTHRIDRFWVPMLPVLALLAGIGAAELLGQGRGVLARALQAAAGAAIAGSLIYNLAFDVSPLCGFNGYLLDEKAARAIAEPASIRLLNDALPEDSKTLLVGEAQVFDVRRPVIYHTVFNENLFEAWFAAPPDSDGIRRLKPAEELRRVLDEQGVTHVFVNWLEVLRYRTTYGYSDFVTPEHVQGLVDAGVLARVPLPVASTGQDVSGLDSAKRDDLQTWGRALVVPNGDRPWFPAYELFEVRR